MNYRLTDEFPTAFNESQSGFNDPFKPSQPKTTTFDDNFDNKPTAFDDDSSWHGNSWNTQANDPFAGSHKPDPFAANASPAKDVSVTANVSEFNWNHFLYSPAKTHSAAIHSPFFMHRLKAPSHRTHPSRRHQPCHRKRPSSRHLDQHLRALHKDQESTHSARRRASPTLMILITRWVRFAAFFCAQNFLPLSLSFLALQLRSWRFIITLSFDPLSTRFCYQTSSPAYFVECFCFRFDFDILIRNRTI